MLVNTKVDMRFYIYKASWLSESVKTRLIEQHQHKVNAAGQFCITSDQYRTQEANRMDCLQKLKTYILEASQEPGETSDAQKAHVHALHRKQQLRVKKEKMERASIKRDRVKGGNKYSAD